MKYLPGVRFGRQPASKIDWRNKKLNERDDDKPLKKTPKSVVRLLGFDPLKRGK